MRSSAPRLAAWIAFLASATPASAFSVLPSAGIDGARWREFPVRFKINPAHSSLSDGDLLAVTAAAFGLWNAVPTSRLRAEAGGFASVTAAELLDGTSAETAIVFEPDVRGRLGVSESSVLGVGIAVFERDRYVQGMIIINANAAAVRAADPERLRLIVAHEAGHAFGLGHTNEESALMYPFAQRLDRLGADDVAGISYLYPMKEGADGMLFGCGGLGKRSTGDGGRFSGVGPFLAAWLGWALAFMAARMATRKIRGARA